MPTPMPYYVFSYLSPIVSTPGDNLDLKNNGKVLKRSGISFTKKCGNPEICLGPSRTQIFL